MRIKLFYPEVFEIARFKEKRKEYPPFGVMYLASVIEKEGYFIEVNKITSSNDIFALSDFDIVMYSLSSSVTYNMMLSNRNNNKINSTTKIIIGGIHASLYPEQSSHDFNADYLIKGEGEISIVRILESIKSNNNNIDIPGVLTMYNRNIKKLGYAEIVRDLDTIPFPARHLLPVEDVIMIGRLSRSNLKMTHILTSRGCPYNCFFCGGIIKNHRYRTGKNILQELYSLKKEYGIEGFVINDENFIIEKSKVINICKEISNIQLPWSALSRVDTIDDDICRILKESNCIELKFGLESGSNTMLKWMNKSCNINDAQNAINLCSQYGIKAKLFLLHGFPHENRITTKETIDFLDKNKLKIDRISLFRWTPLPGSYIYNNYKKYNINGNMLKFENAFIYHHENNWYIDDATNNMINEQYNILNDFIESEINNR